MKTDFFTPAADKGAEGELKSVPIRLVRLIRFTILSLWLKKNNPFLYSYRFKFFLSLTHTFYSNSSYFNAN